MQLRFSDYLFIFCKKKDMLYGYIYSHMCF